MVTKFTRIAFATTLILTFGIEAPMAAAKNYYISQRRGGYRNGVSPDKACRQLVWQILNFDKLQPGDTVYIAPGSYATKGHFTIGYLNRRNINGTKDKPIRFVADTECKHFPNEKKGPVYIGGYAYQSISLEGASHIILDGLTVRCYYNGGTAIGIRSSTGNIVRNCKIDYVRGSNRGVGIHVLHADALIQQCSFKNIYQMGVYCRDKSTTVIEDCTFDGIKHRAIGCWQRDSKLTVRRCKIRRSQTGIWLDPIRGGLIENCWIRECSQEGIASQGYGPSTIQHCTITNNQGDGIRLQTGYYKNKNGLRVLNSIVANNGKFGINYVARTGHGNNTAYLKHSHNLFHNNRLGNMTSSLKKDKSEIFENPLFTGQGSSEIPQISPGSPAVDAGMVISGVRDDLVGWPRPSGQGPDIGAVESGSSDRPSVYYVSPKGNDRATGDSPNKAWRSLKHAMTKLIAGDTLYVAGGRYLGGFQATLTGAKKFPIKIIADVDGSKTGIRGPVVIDGPDRRYNLQLKGENVVFENFHFAGRKYSYGLYVNATNHFHFNNCTWTGGYRAAIFAGPTNMHKCTVKCRKGIFIYPTNISYRSSQQINSRPKYECSITECSFEGQGQYVGLWVHDWYASKNGKIVKTIVVDKCRFKGGYFLTYGCHLVVTNSLFLQTFYGTYVSGLYGAKDERVQAVIANNTYYDSKYYSLCFAQKCDVRLVNNIICKSRWAIYGYSSEAKVTATNNILHDYKSLMLAYRGFKMNTSNFIKKDPMFVDAGKGDFDLKEGSPAIDQGLETEYSKTDLLGRKRPIGLAIDIGAIESESGADDDPGPDAPVATLWGVGARNGELFSIKDYNKPATTLSRYGQLRSPSGQPITNVDALAVDAGAKAYLVFDGTLSNGGQGSVLGRISTNDLPAGKGSAQTQLKVQMIGPIDGAGGVTGLAFQPGTGKLYAVSHDLHLYTIDKMNGKIKTKQRIHWPRRRRSGGDRDEYVPRRLTPEDLVFDGTGKLFVVDRDYLIYEVDAAKGTIIKLAKATDRDMKVKGVAFDHLTGRLIGSATGNRSLYQLRVPKGIHRKLGSVGIPEVGALAVHPGEGVLGTKLRITEWRVTSGQKK